MSWSDLYPALTDEMLRESLDSHAGSPGPFDPYWQIEKVVNRQDCDHLISICIHRGSTILPPLLETGGGEEDAQQLFDDLRLRSFLNLCPTVLQNLKGSGMRIYLPKDLEILLPDLVGSGFEVVLMALAHPPSSIARLWPLLALEGPVKLVTVTVPEKFLLLYQDFERTASMSEVGFGAWRVPFIGGPPHAIYYPLSSTYLGTAANLPVRDLLAAFMWHRQRGSLCELVNPAESGAIFLGDKDDPLHEIDLIFATVALYPRLAASALLTIATYGFSAPLFPLDIEYVTWANPASQLLLLRPSRCCGQSDSVI